MMKLEELPIDLGFVSPDNDRDIKPLGSVELVDVTLILNMSIELTKTNCKKIGLD